MEEDSKLYYSISEVAEKFGVSQSLLRFWEEEFPQYIKPKRNKRGVRFFTNKDIENIERIYQLVKVNKFTLEGAKKALRKRVPAEDIEDDPCAVPPKTLRFSDQDLYDKLLKIKTIASSIYESI
ncbi:MAG: MerR family transcriptional regulator [Bacteroidales bacterium]|nr:MerR family transcriptional regulator [Bacteroidales bacterium]